jgi:hypothetical protein
MACVAYPSLQLGKRLKLGAEGWISLTQSFLGSFSNSDMLCFDCRCCDCLLSFTSPNDSITYLQMEVDIIITDEIRFNQWEVRNEEQLWLLLRSLPLVSVRHLNPGISLPSTSGSKT